MTGRRYALLAVTLLVTTVALGCASATDAVSTRALEELAPATTTEAPTTTIAPGRNFCDDPNFDATASFRWVGPIPTPGEMPDGTALRTIQDRETLKVGVDENTMYFSSRDPRSGEFEGFEPELARLIAHAIFGDDDPHRVEFVPVVTGNKVSAVADDKVDMTISVVSQTCDRWEQVDFTTTYYETTQRILVPPESPIHGVRDLEGRRVCVTSGSSSQNYLTKNVPDATIVPVEYRSDCLVALQEDRADAVLLPYSILAGLAAQDPTKTVLPGERLPTQSYGIAIKPQPGEELVRFVNALLEQWRTDDTLETLQDKWPDELKAVPPAARYRD